MNVWSDQEFVDNLIKKPFNWICESIYNGLQWFTDLVNNIANNEEEKPRKLPNRIYKPNKSEENKDVCFGNISQLVADQAAQFNTNKETIKPVVVENTEESDLADYEYCSDGKRMCFINYVTGHVVYHEDHLFHVLKRKMLGKEI